MKYLLLLALLVAASRAQLVPPEEPSSANSKYSLSGTVINSSTGEPISRALVQVFSSTSQTTFTDSSGRFEFGGLPPGATGFVARRPGFLSPEEVDPTPQLSTVTIGPNTAPLLVKLIPTGVIFGHALKPNGEPIRGLPIQLFYLQISEGRRRWDLMSSSATNEQGEFRVANLKPGRYALAAGPTAHSGWIGVPGGRAREAGYPLTFYPGVSDWSSAAPLDVAPGQQLETGFTISPEPLFRVTGSISGLPLVQNWGQLQISPRGMETQAIPIDQAADGTFEARIPSGSYYIRASGYSPQGPFEGELPLTVRSDMAGLNLIVGPAAALPVEVSVNRTRPATPGASLQQDSVNIRLRGQSSKVPSPDFAFSIGPHRKSEQRVRDVLPGTYTVEVRPDQPELYVDSAQCGTVDLLRESLVISQGTSTPIRVVLRDDGGRLSGNVLSTEKLATATVLIIPDRAPRQITTLMVDPGGQFQSGKLAPGDYTVLAFDRVAGLEYSSPEVLDPFLSYATHSSVTPNGESSVTVNLVRTAP